MSRSVISRIVCLALAGSVLTAIPVDDAQAQRKTLLEQWFPKAAQRMKQNRQPQFDTSRPVSTPVEKVSSPGFFNYKTEGLATISLAGLIPPAEPVAALAIEAETPLVDAIDKVLSPPVYPEEYNLRQFPAIDRSNTGAIVPEATPILTNAAVEGWSLKVEEGIGQALKAHYAKSPQYLWIGSDGKLNADAKAVLTVLENAAEVGLSPDDYKVDTAPVELGTPDFAGRNGAKVELALSAAALRYAADAKNGRVNPNGLSGYHDFPAYKRAYEGIVKTLVESSDPSSELLGLNPDNSRFAMLMTELAELRSSVDKDSLEPVEAGTFFKPGQEHAELPKVVALIQSKASVELKEKHSATFAGYLGTHSYSEELVALVRDFQKENGLGPDGIIGKNTIAKLQTASPMAKIEKIELAMERLRWLPEEFGRRHVFINQPAYTASYMVDDKAELSMRAVVGKPSNQTYFFHDTIEVVEVNPYWNVPYSIMINQKLGKIRANPGYLTANGYEVVTARGVTDPYSVDWYSGAPVGVSIRQKPGAGNALGELKILFPNRHAIYMHDTPERYLFENSSRANSSGCIRLHKPREMAAAVLQTTVGEVGQHIASGENKTIAVQNKIPVYVSYFTAWPDDSGKVGFYADIYGRDKALKTAIEKTRDMRSQTSLVSS